RDRHKHGRHARHHHLRPRRRQQLGSADNHEQVPRGVRGESEADVRAGADDGGGGGEGGGWSEMTAEMAILNREAVALAADSAVTVSSHRGQKIWNTANKLFALSKFEPVGIMVYGHADLCGVPWETIIKCYREERYNQSFKTLPEYVDD